MRRGGVFILVVSLVGGTSVGGVGDADRELTNPRALAALEYFQHHSSDFDAFLRQQRPAGLTAAIRAAAIASLPEEGELTPTARQAAKLATIQVILGFHGREHDLETRLISVGRQAAIGLYARAVLLISSDAIDLLSSDELRAVTAHELAHEYVWSEYENARTRQDRVTLQELELRCDGIAIITLDRLGLDPKHLESAVTKLTRYNERSGATATAARYVPLAPRQQFIRAMMALVVRVDAPPQAAHPPAQGQHAAREERSDSRAIADARPLEEIRGRVRALDRPRWTFYSAKPLQEKW